MPLPRRGSGRQAISAGDILAEGIERLRGLAAGRISPEVQNAALAGDDAVAREPLHSGKRICAQFRTIPEPGKIHVFMIGDIPLRMDKVINVY